VDVTTRTIRVGMVGGGTVGGAVLRLLRDHADDIERRAGCRLEVVRVAVRDPTRARDVPLDAGLLTGDPHAVTAGDDVDVVVEVMGGVDPGRALLLEAMGAGKHVVTANKELLSTVGRELFDAADEAGVDLYFEGAVGGGIPLIRPLKESLAGERIDRILGILNGTTNYVLTRMTEDGLAFADALGEAQRLGDAERDPSDDVEGHDAAAKCAILASIAFNARVVTGDVRREGIAAVTPDDIEFARRMGYVVKLLAVAELDDGQVSARVQPVMIPVGHPLAAVRDAFNAVFLEGEHVGELMLYGRGAGGGPTATAVVGDVVDVARNIMSGARGVGCTCYEDRGIRSPDDLQGQFYLLMDVADRPGVLAKIAGAFGDHRVSIKSVWQEGFGDEALLVLITHTANEAALRRTVEDLRALDVVNEVRSVMRVEDEG
jgi:homoserine dehydrogenase